MENFYNANNDLNGWSVSSVWDSLVKNFYYDSFLKGVQCNNSLSSIPPKEVMRTARTVDEDRYYTFIREDSKAKIEDVKKTNEAIGSVSAFMSVPAVIGFFAKLFYHKNMGFHSTTGLTDRNDDKMSYLWFFNRHLLGETDTTKYADCDGLAFVFYKMVRCGLLHGESVNNKDVTNVRVELSHSKANYKSLKAMDAALRVRTSMVSIIINATQVCDELLSLVPKALDEADADERKSIEEIYTEDPPIIFIKKE